jgi:cell division protein FtsN
MNNGERSYLEIKVTFIHIVVLLTGVILIGIFLFYLGYRAGKASLKDQAGISSAVRIEAKNERIQINNKKKRKSTPADQKNVKKTTINEELKLHQKPVRERFTQKKQKVRTKTLQKTTYYSIQVGAFSNFSNAKKYAERFSDLGYQTDILSTYIKDKKLYRVRVGSFENKGDAKAEKSKLEKMEKKKFAIMKNG